MSFALKVNFLKGWPNPYVLDFVSKNTPASAGIGEGKIAHLDADGKWVLGVSAVNQTPCVIWNGGAGDGDQNKPFPTTAAAGQANYVAVNWGGIQGVSFHNALLLQTNAFSGTPAFGDSLYADVDGLLKVCAGSAAVPGKVIVALVHKVQHQSALNKGIQFITIVPDMSKRVTV